MPYKYPAVFNGVTRLEDKEALDKNSLIIILCTYESIIGLKILLEGREMNIYHLLLLTWITFDRVVSNGLMCTLQETWHSKGPSLQPSLEQYFLND